MELDNGIRNEVGWAGACNPNPPVCKGGEPGAVHEACHVIFENFDPFSHGTYELQKSWTLLYFRIQEANTR